MSARDAVSGIQANVARTIARLDHHMDDLTARTMLAVLTHDARYKA
jgi:hypothetical protein